MTIERQYKMCTVGKKDDKWITETKTVNHTKSSRVHKIDTGVRTIPVVPELEKILRKIEAQKTVDAEDIFVHNDGTHITSGMVKAKLYKYARWLKMDCVKSAHDLRRTCATFLKAAGATDEQIRIILGHSDIKTTQESYIFDQSEMEDKENLMEKAVGSLPELIPVKRFGGIRRIK